MDADTKTDFERLSALLPETCPACGDRCVEYREVRSPHISLEYALPEVKRVYRCKARICAAAYPQRDLATIEAGCITTTRKVWDEKAYSA